MFLYSRNQKYYATKENNNYYGIQPYIESDGIAYTNLIEQGDTLNVKYVSVKFQTLDTPINGYRYVCGYYRAAQYQDYYYGIVTGPLNGWKFGWWTGMQTSSNFYEFTDEDVVQEYNRIDRGVFNLTSTMFICFGYYRYPYGGYNAGPVPRKIRLWYLRFYSNTNLLVANYEPRVVNNEVGLYDTVRNKFFPNVAGAGELKYCI